MASTMVGSPSPTTTASKPLSSGSSGNKVACGPPAISLAPHGRKAEASRYASFTKGVTSVMPITSGRIAVAISTILLGRQSMVGGVGIEQMHLMARLLQDGREHQHSHRATAMTLRSRRGIDQQYFDSRSRHHFTSPTIAGNRRGCFLRHKHSLWVSRDFHRGVGALRIAATAHRWCGTRPSARMGLDSLEIPVK